MFFKLILASFHGIAEVFIIGILGFLIIAGRKGTQSYLDFITKLVINLTLPCLVFYNIIGKFKPAEVEYWWAFPMLSVIINVAGVLMAWVYLKIDRSIKSPGEFMALTAFQNWIFLPLAMAPALFGPEELPVFLNLLFLFNLLSIPTFFTVAVWIIHSSAGKKIGFKELISPPIAATVVSSVLVFSGFGNIAPEWLMRPLGAVGNMTGPLSMLFVGGIIISSLTKVETADWVEPVKITLLKAIVLPGFASGIVYYFHPPYYIGLFAIMQSAMPSALLVALVAPDDGVSRKNIAAAILLTSLASIIAVPFFMGIFGAIYG